MPTSYLDDHPPVAVADAITLSANQAALDTQTSFTYVDADGVTQSVTQDVYGTTFDVLANDTDPDPTDAGHFWIFDFTQQVDASGAAAGTLSVEKDANGHDVLRFYDTDPALQTGTHTVTFTYRAADEWANANDSATWSNSVSQPATVTLTITGNSIPGETITGGNHPQALTGGGGNDLLLGGNQKDTLSGGGGADTLAGGNGKDLILGGDGNDRLYGGSLPRPDDHHGDNGSGDDDHGDGGPDTLNGGNGDDTLTGGHGHDLFVFDYAFGHDVITDFDPHTDKISVDHNMWTSFADVMAHAVEGPHEVVTLTSDFGGYTITLLDTELHDLRSSDFIFT